jgi:GNAT superfamily N-acetyltransferase
MIFGLCRAVLTPPATLDGLTHAENWLISRDHQRKDADFARLDAFNKVMNDVHKKYWEQEYANNFRLDLLCTIPAHRRKGAGTMLTRWGMDLAIMEGANVGVESSPMGLPLYERLGFKLEEIRHVKVKGDGEELLVRVMSLAIGSW